MMKAETLTVRLLMKILRMVLMGALLLPGGMLRADEQKGEIKETVGPMTEPVIRQRLKLLGYTDINIQRANTLRYEIRAVKHGKRAVLQFHPQTGEIRDVTRGRAPKRVWTMPVEPVRPQARPERPMHPVEPGETKPLENPR